MKHTAKSGALWEVVDRIQSSPDRSTVFPPIPRRLRTTTPKAPEAPYVSIYLDAELKNAFRL